MNDAVKGRYLLKFDEINRITGNEIITFESDTETAVKKFRDILVDMYIEGFSAAAYMLDTEDKRVQERNIDKTVAYSYPDGVSIEDKRVQERNVNKMAAHSYPDGVSIEDKFREYYRAQNEQELERLLNSEAHRAYNTGAYDLALSVPGAVSEWVTVNDFRVRETHEYLEGITTPVGGYFYTFDGDRARFPGDFKNPANNANCRCILRYTV